MKCKKSHVVFYFGGYIPDQEYKGLAIVDVQYLLPKGIVWYDQTGIVVPAANKIAKHIYDTLKKKYNSGDHVVYIAIAEGVRDSDKSLDVVAYVSNIPKKFEVDNGAVLLMALNQVTYSILNLSYCNPPETYQGRYPQQTTTGRL